VGEPCLDPVVGVAALNEADRFSRQIGQMLGLDDSGTITDMDWWNTVGPGTILPARFSWMISDALRKKMSSAPLRTASKSTELSYW
jgi:hypothetical protein